jgi:hypothetical protein
MLAQSLLQHDGVLTMDKTIKYRPEESVLKLMPGNEIKLNEAAFVALSRAFFAEIEAKFG